jgi:hypothetical protein
MPPGESTILWSNSVDPHRLPTLAKSRSAAQVDGYRFNEPVVGVDNPLAVG